MNSSDIVKAFTQNPYVQLATFFIIFNPCLWNVLGRFEYKTKLVSRTVGRETGVYACAVLIFTLGLVRDAFFEMAIASCKLDNQVPNPLDTVYLRCVGWLIGVSGWVLVISSMYRLGIVGTYLGDYFGILFPAKITAFPFSHFDHPMYQGATMAFMGTALAQVSPVGVVLAGLAGLVYTIAGMIEGPFTAMIYSAGKPQLRPKRKTKYY